MKKHVKKVTALLLVLILAVANVAVIAGSEPHESEFIPVRATMEAIGGEVSWDATNRSITATVASSTIVFFAGSQRAYVNGEVAGLQHNVFITGGVAFIHPDDYVYVLMRGVGLEVGGPLNLTKLEANLLAPLLMDIVSVPGMVVAIVDANEGSTWIQGFGYACTTQGTQVDEGTVFGIGSISKPVTAIAVMQLVEQGIIDLDVPIIEYLPDFSVLPSPTLGGDYRNITTRMLLTHTAGIINQFCIEEYLFSYNYVSLGAHNPHYMNTFLEYMAIHYLDHPEGEIFSYSNQGYVLLGVLVAAMAGNSNIHDGFISYTQDNIFAPAGMTRSSFALDNRLMPYFARPYLDVDTPDEHLFSNGLPTASMVSTGYDMARLMHILLNDDGQLLEPGNVRAMMQPHDYDFSAVGLKYGFGFVHLTSASGFTAVGHNGQRINFNAYMLMDVESGLGVFVATNGLMGLSISNLMAFTLLEMAVLESNGLL